MVYPICSKEKSQFMKKNNLKKTNKSQIIATNFLSEDAKRAHFCNEAIFHCNFFWKHIQFNWPLFLALVEKSVAESLLQFGIGGAASSGEVAVAPIQCSGPVRGRGLVQVHPCTSRSPHSPTVGWVPRGWYWGSSHHEILARINMLSLCGGGGGAIDREKVTNLESWFTVHIIAEPVSNFKTSEFEAGKCSLHKIAQIRSITFLIYMQ